MLGTDTFPALWLPLDSKILPKQVEYDTVNSEFGVIATIVMVLLDLVTDGDWKGSNSSSTFDDRFSSTTL